jgi:hypothetical protein
MIGAIEQERLNRLIETSKQIQPGDAKIKVRELLGRPIDQRETSGFILRTGPPQWVYGTIVDQQGIVSGDLAVPFPLSIKLRWFGAHESDLVINWAPDGAVAAVTRPERAL